ncbi:MAG: hypothetical protein WBC13_00375 [Dokdonella sp.]
MNNKKSIVSLLTLPVATGAFLAVASLSPVLATENECNAETDLQGTVTRNEASVTNYSTSDCSYDATLALYDSPKTPETYQWIESQKLIGSKTVTVKAGETVSIKVDGTGPSCYVQSDLIRGSEVMEVPFYRNAMDVDVYSVSCTTTTTTNNDSTNNTTTNNVTNNNVTNNNSVSTVTEKLAATGDAAVIFAFLLAGISTIAAGLYLRKAGK